MLKYHLAQFLFVKSGYLVQLLQIPGILPYLNCLEIVFLKK